MTMIVAGALANDCAGDSTGNPLPPMKRPCFEGLMSMTWSIIAPSGSISNEKVTPFAPAPQIATRPALAVSASFCFQKGRKVLNDLPTG